MNTADQYGYYQRKLAKEDAMLAAGLGLAGTAAGAIAGSFLGSPGMGASIGNKIGKAGASMFAHGGNLIEFPHAAGTHEQSRYGGIPIGGQNYAEGGETMINKDGKSKYVFSNRLLYDEKSTFADVSKKLGKSKLGRNDIFDKNTTKRNLAKLEQEQEIVRHELGLIDQAQQMAALGGFMNQMWDGGLFPSNTVDLVDQAKTIENTFNIEGSQGYGNYGFTTDANQNLTKQQALEKATSEYWNKYDIGSLPKSLQGQAFDFAFNSEDPRASLLVAAGKLTPEEKIKMYNVKNPKTGKGMLNPALVQAAWDKNKDAVLNSGDTLFEPFAAERYRSYGADKAKPEHLDRISRTVDFSRQYLNPTNGDRTEPVQEAAATTNANTEQIGDPTDYKLSTIDMEDPGSSLLPGYKPIRKAVAREEEYDMSNDASQFPTDGSPKDWKEDAANNKKNKRAALLGALAQTPGYLSQLMYGLRGGDNVSFERVNPERLNPRTAINLATAQANRIAAGSKAGVRSNAKTMGDLIAGYGAADAALQSNIGNLIGQTTLQAQNINTTANNRAKELNANISMQERIARQQEIDAARSAVTSGLSGLGAVTATGIKDKRAYDAQDRYNKLTSEQLTSLFKNLDWKDGKWQIKTT